MRRTILTSPVLLIFILVLNIKGFSFSIGKSIIPENHISPACIEYQRASVFVKLSAKEFEAISGKKLNFLQRIYFKIIQRKLKHELKKAPDLLITNYYDPQKEKFKFDPLWFVIAAFIGPLGLLVAYTSKVRKGGPTKKNRITSAWLGFALFILWFGFLFLF
ncbi:MAG TPA: hypothetical protein VGP55_05045 [Chitinophagaceae bacterium]|nr:hypothetical protein [Chitinophagaceae bacterium]